MTLVSTSYAIGKGRLSSYDHCYCSKASERLLLPIHEIKDNLLSELSSNNLVILSAPPGAGKSTELPLWLLNDDSLGKIYLLQPRRMAAKSIACYLAKQLGEQVGSSVGYRLRNDVCTSKSTKLEVITEGILTQIMQSDPVLTDCGIILFDEFHERSVHADIAFAIARDIQQGLREDLKLILMSATLDNTALKENFPEASFLASAGRSFPVTVSYQARKTETFWREHVLQVIRGQLAHQGSILVFLPGSGDIRYLEQQLETELPNHFVLAPLYGELSLAEQQQAIAKPKQGYKLVLATNIAETSLTIEGINLVIDAGLEKVAVFDHQTLTNKLVTREISKASAIQRAGRAGRLSQGHCIRCYSQENFDRRVSNAPVEIVQSDLQPCLIEAARWGVSELEQLPLLTLPEKNQQHRSWQALIALNIVDDKHRLTEHGQQISQLATHPRFAHMIIQAKQLEQQYSINGLGYLACLLAALLEERDIFTPMQRQDNVDITDRVSLLISSKGGHRYKRILTQAKQLARQAKLSASQSLPIEHCGNLLVLAYPERIAKSKALGVFQAENGKQFTIESSDLMADAEFICAANVMAYKTKLQVVLAAKADLAVLRQWQQVNITTERQLRYDDNKQQISQQILEKLGAIVLSAQRDNSTINDSDISNMWCDFVLQNGLQCLAFSEKVSQLLARWQWINQHQTHLDLPLADEKSLLEHLSEWFVPFIQGARKLSALRKLDFYSMLLSLLDYPQQQLLEQIAPALYLSPTGQRVPIEYDEHQSPRVSVAMQAMYGQKETPQIGDVASGNGVSLTLALLSPAKRPIQLTQDLPAFWQGSYEQVKKEMKGRYPKHFWPDDPANENPTTKTKRFM